MLIKIKHADDVCVLHLSGRFATGADLDYLLDKLNEIRSCNCTKVLADLRDVPSMGSTGIGFVVGVYSSVTKNRRGRFVMVGAAPRVREVFNLTHLSGVIPSAPDVPSAMAMLDASMACSESAISGTL
jgi:anti-anti-sigma factor